MPHIKSVSSAPKGPALADFRLFQRFSFAVLFTFFAVLSTAVPSRAEQAVEANRARITQVVDDSALTTLKGNVHPLAKPQFDKGEVAGSLPMKRMLMVLKRGDIQQAALKTFMDQQQDKHSASYRQWLTPQQLGTTYGPAAEDVKTITDWLQGRGFQIGNVSKSRMFIEFSGTAAQVSSAFHTSIHSYVVEGKQRYANASDPSIPAALAPVVAGIDSLNSFPRRPLSRVVGNFKRDKQTGRLTPVAGTKPKTTLGSGNNTFYGVGPGDLATIYNISPLWNAGTPLDGTGQVIAIAGRSNINPQDAYDFRTIFGLPTGGSLSAFQQKYLNIILDGPDPGNLGGNEEVEANVDIQWSGAVAKSALIDFVLSESTTTTGGEDLSSLYIIDNNLAPVMSYSFGTCELGLGTGGNAFISALWEQAAAQGISAFVASGDEGSASCDAGSTTGAQFGYSVSGNASTPYNVAVGGTDFDQLDNDPTNYWNATNNSTTQASAKGYIPETTWNNSCTNSAYSALSGSTDPITNCNNSDVINTYGGLDIGGGSGGPSTCIQSDGSDPSSCVSGYAKPSWQVGTFSDNVRDIPDVSLFASNGFSGSAYIVCVSDENSDGGACSLDGDYFGVGGTSVSSPAIAGMFSILNQKLAARVGNPNYALYNLAGKESASNCNSTNGPGGSCIFNDVTKGTISQPCQANVSGACLTETGDTYGVLVSDDGSGYGTIDDSGYPSDLAWNAGVGYDYATGLGTLNAYNLVTQWSSADFLASATTLTLSKTNFTHGTGVTANVTVTSSTGTPSGDISFNGAAPNGSIGYAPLSGGSASVTLNSLPGGSYNVVAHYGGNNDGTNIFGGSDSNPVAVTVSPEASTTTLTAYLYDPNTGDLSTISSAPYGSALIARLEVAGASGNGYPTGTVAVSSGGTALVGSPFKLNSTGTAEDQFFSLNAGSYTVLASYSGDPSFNASSATGSLTITQQTPTATLSPSATNVTQGTKVTLDLLLNTTTYVGLAPTGTVTFYNGTTQIGSPATLSSSQGGGFPMAVGGIDTTSLPVGSNSITARYNGDTNYAAVTSAAMTVTVTGSGQGLAVLGSNITAVAGASGTSTITVTPSGGFTGAVNLTCSVTGPTGAVSVPTCSSFNPNPVTISGTAAVNSTLTVATTATTTASTQYTVTVNAADKATGKITATDQIPMTVTSATAPESIAFTPAPTAVTIATPGQSGMSTLSITPTNYTGTLKLSCVLATGPTGAVDSPTCSVPSTLAITSNSVTTATATIDTTGATSSALKYPAAQRWYAAGGAALACILFFGIPARRRGWKSMLGLILALVTMVGVGCGGGGSKTTTPTTPTVTVTPASSSIMVTSPLSVTAAVSGSGETPTGSVVFSSGSYTSASQTLAGGSVTFSIPANSLTVGTDKITAAYSGDSNFNSASGSANVTVTSGSTGTTAGTYTFTVTATDSADSSITATGTITVTVD